MKARHYPQTLIWDVVPLMAVLQGHTRLHDDFLMFLTLNDTNEYRYLCTFMYMVYPCLCTVCSNLVGWLIHS